ncbi:Uncharacterised protein [Leclercia adecarboxylata]|nr:Uncharacterised protein [Leclercia adecarboxylata]
MLGFENVGLAGVVHGPLLLAQQEIAVDRNTHIGVRLAQHRRIGPVVTLINGVNHTEQFIVRHCAVQHFNDFPALVVARSLNVVARSGDGPHQRLTPGAHTCQHGGVERVGIVFVIFVHNGAARRSTIARVADQRLKTGTIFRPVHVGGINLHSKRVTKRRGAFTHQARRAKHFPRLLFCRGAGVNLCAKLVVTGEAEQCHTGRDRRLTILTRDLGINLAETPQFRSLAYPAERGADDKQLPGFQGNGHAFEGPLTFRMRQELDKLCRLFRQVFIEPV